MKTNESPALRETRPRELILYHYTIGQWMTIIIEQGEIRPTTAGIPKGERPIVWFTSKPEWEETANKMWLQDGQLTLLTREQTREQCSGLFRIAVLPESVPYTWKQLRFLSKMHPAVADGLEEKGRELGSNPDDWFGSFKPITRDQWIAIEVLSDGGWVAYVAESVERV